MKTSEFIKYINEQVARNRQEWKISAGKAFGMWFAMEVLELEETEAFEAASVDGGNDKDIDLFYVDHEAERVVIAQCKFTSKGNYGADKNELLGLLHTTDWLKDPEALGREGRKDLESAAEDFKEAISKGYSIEYDYVYCGPAKREVEDAARQFNKDGATSTPSRYCRVVNLERLKDSHEEAIDQRTRVETCEIALLPDTYFEQKGDYGNALVATVSGEELRRLHETYGDRLFDRNVRLFLGAHKGGVNAGIRDTLESEAEVGNFWAYNNGVTFICDRYDPEDQKITLHNFSIVNGCQTTVSLANAPLDAARKTKVLVRFIAAPERVIDSIIRFTNSQNPIRLWDLNAQDKLQKKIKRDLAELPQPFFYALRKGETRQLSSQERQRFKRDGKLQIIPHDVNAQYLAAFRGLPAIAYKDKGKVFSSRREEVFPQQIRAEEIVLCWQAANVVKELVKSELEQAVKAEDADRVEILKRGAAFFVLAVMGMVLSERNGATFLNKIKAEVAGSKKTINRLRNYARIALEWYVEAMRELKDAGHEVPSLVRTQDGWLKVHPKISTKWKVFSVARNVMEDALPKL